MDAMKEAMKRKMMAMKANPSPQQEMHPAELGGAHGAPMEQENPDREGLLDQAPVREGDAGHSEMDQDHLLQILAALSDHGSMGRAPGSLSERVAVNAKKKHAEVKADMAKKKESKK